MPRIDPVQLLNCLSVLLSPNGGVKSRDEVQRIASLMTKFSKKLVSKCIYIQILKSTETELLGLFMGSGGWRLVHMWLTESIVAKNWPLVKELLELLLLCPVDIERLKTNNCPKLVKELSKDGNYYAIRALASKLVEQWLKTVKGEAVTIVKLSDIQEIINSSRSDERNDQKDDVNGSSNIENANLIKQEKNIEEQSNLVIKQVKIEKENEDKEVVESETKIDAKEETNKNDEKDLATLPVLKISLKDGKQIVSQLDDSDSQSSEKPSSTDKEKPKSSSKSKEKNSSSKSDSSKHKSDSSHKHRSSSHRRDSPTHSSRDKLKDKTKHSSHSSKSSKHSSSSKKSSEKLSSNKSKDDKTPNKLKEENKSKDVKHKEKSKVEDQEDNEKKVISNDAKETLDKLQTPSIHKLGKIPKLNDTKKEAPSISIEVRKPDEPKPKTVKTFNSKFRKHGLDEEIKPPPSRAALLNKKSSTVVPPMVSMPKRPSPVHNEPPPEKKPKTMEPIEKPGAIKLIPAKPKPMLLLESDMFMDALNASATNKKEPKKRKRRTSGSKDGAGPNDSSPPSTPTSSATSPISEKKSAPLRFYQDTLDTEDDKDRVLANDEDDQKSPVPDEDSNSKETPDVPETDRSTVNGLKSVLSYHKKKGPKKSIRWKPDSELEDIQYFELDETERVNVTKPFTDLKHLERRNEREAFLKGRNLANVDTMEERTNWRPLIPIDTDGQIPVEHGKNSREKDIQALRQKGTLQPLYFHKSMIPESSAEPDPETHPYQEPTIIPLDDATGIQDNVSDFRNMPWPEPKGNAPLTSTANINIAPMFPPNMGPFPSNFPNPQFPVPGFQGPPVEWQNGMPPPHLMGPNNMPSGPIVSSPMPPVMPPNMPPNMPPGMMMTPESMMMAPDMFNGPNPMFPPVPPENFNMGQNMFPPNMNIPVPGMPGLEGISGPSFRGPMRGRGSAGHWRGKNGPGTSWDGQQRGRGGLARGGRKTVCMYFQRKGSCRQGDNCSFLHPGVNCPY